MRIPSRTMSWTSLALAAALSGCAQTPGALNTPSADVLMGMTITTSSDEARTQFLAGMDDADLARAVEARDAFAAAVSADPTFALGYLELANNGNSLNEFTTNLEKAEANAAAASQPEQLMIRAARQSFDGDAEGQLQTLQELTQLEPQSARAWLMLGNAQTGLNQVSEARASYGKALELSSSLTAAHLAMANSYLYNEPKDFAQTEAHARHAVEQRPEEPTPYDILGDAHRAQGNLEAARTDYTMAAERAPTQASPIQQRGHVNSFLGDYAAARADYDRAMELGQANQRPNFGLYRAFVNLHEGNPQAAIDELNALIASVDGMGIPEPTGVKITLVFNALEIAIHNRMTEPAEALITQLTDLINTQNGQTTNDNFHRGNDAFLAQMVGGVAMARGDLATARAKAQEMAKLLEPIANPRKLEPMHQLLGEVSLAENKPAEAVAHLRQADQTNTYVRYLQAKALEGAGQADAAKALYTEVANNNFNSVYFAMVRAEAKAKAGLQ